MTCVRKPNVQIVSGFEVKSAPDVTVNLRLARKPLPITLPGYNSSIIDKIEQEIAAARLGLETEISSLKQNLGKWGDNKDGTYAPINGGYGPVTSQCPDGYYAYAVRNWGNSTGGLCIGCFVAVQVLCKKLNAP